MGESNNISIIKEIIDKILIKDNYLPNMQILRLKKNWEKIVGASLSKNTTPYKIINNNILLINCNHQGWINTLQLYKTEIINNIKNNSDNKIDITDIRFIYYIKDINK